MSQAEALPEGPLPDKEKLFPTMREIFHEVGAQNLTMKVLRGRLATVYKQDFKEHTQALQEYVKEILAEPVMQKELAVAQKQENAAQKKVGGTKKSSKASPTSKRSRGDDAGEAKKTTKKAKKEKIEGEPKFPQTAFFCYSGEVRPKVMEDLRAANDGKLEVAKVGTKVGEMWKALTEEEKQKYTDMAAEDKKRFAREVEEWVAAGNDAPVRGGAKKEAKPTKEKKEKGEKKVTKKEKKAAREGPKKATTGFFFYTADVRPKVMEENKAANDGKLKMGEVGTKMGEMWKALTEEEKKKYTDLADEDKKRYARECEETGYDPKAKKASASSSSGKKEKKEKKPRSPSSSSSDSSSSSSSSSGSDSSSSDSDSDSSSSSSSDSD